MTGYGSVGGFVGSMASQNKESILTNCYATGEVTGSSGIGGFIGFTSFAQAQFINCHATGNTFGSESTGGFIGYTHSSALTFTNCYATGDITAIYNYNFHTQELTG